MTLRYDVWQLCYTTGDPVIQWNLVPRVVIPKCPSVWQHMALFMFTSEFPPTESDWCLASWRLTARSTHTFQKGRTRGGCGWCDNPSVLSHVVLISSDILSLITHTLRATCRTKMTFPAGWHHVAVFTLHARGSAHK